MAFRDVDAEGGGSLTVAVTQALGMGGPSAIVAAAAALKEYEVRCLAMCGVCAGRRGDVALGDVIIADRVWQYDTGKRRAEATGGERIVEEQEDIEIYRLHPPAWKQAAERFQIDPEAPWLALRPRSYEAQGDWILERVLRGADPVADPRARRSARTSTRRSRNSGRRGCSTAGTLTLTETGRGHVEQVLLIANRSKLPSHLAAPGSRGADREREPRDGTRGGLREALGFRAKGARRGDGDSHWYLRLHGSARIRGRHEGRQADHADADESDSLQEVRGACPAECVLAFVKQHLPLRATRDDPILGARPDEAHARRVLGGSVRTLLTAGKAKLSLGKDTGLDDLQRALDLARGTGDEVLLAHAYLENANARFWRQDYEDARMHYLTAAALFLKHELFARYALAYKLLVLLSLEVGRRDDAVRYYHSAEQVLQGAADADALTDLQSVASKAEGGERR